MKRAPAITICTLLMLGSSVVGAQQVSESAAPAAQTSLDQAPATAVRVQLEAVAMLSEEFRERFSAATAMQFASEMIPLAFVLDEDQRRTVQRMRTRDAVRTVWQQTVEIPAEESVDLLLGGEFPVPVATYNYAARKPASTVQFKEYGVSLKFRVVEVGQHRFTVELTPEVSTVNFAHQINLADYVIPALDSRRTVRRLTLAPGRTILISNLLSQDELSALSRLGFKADQHHAFAELVKFSREAAQPVELLLFVTPLHAARATTPALVDEAANAVPGIVGSSGFATAVEKSKLP